MDKAHIVNGTAYHADTNEKVIKALESARASRARIRVWYGDTDTGKAWAEEYDVLGYVGRSTGGVKIPLLVHNRNSFGGGGILDHCIVRIDTTDGQTLYKHPTFNAGELSIDGTDVYIDGQIQARFDTPAKAAKYVAFLTGKRYSK